MAENNINPVTLLQLLNRMKQVIERAFPENVWITAEVANIRTDQKNHSYFELIQKEDKTTLAKTTATCWSFKWVKIGRKFEEATGGKLAAGMSVLMLVKPSYHPVYGMSLSVEDIDPSFSLGAAELLRRQTIERLTKEKLIDLNRKLPFPEIIQRIAVISSPGAAGYEDFVHLLESNEYGYRFYVKLFPAIMQGEDTVKSVIEAIDKVDAEFEKFDCVCIMRGGGSVLDLAPFDSYEMCARAARMKLILSSNIGHTRDKNVLSMVAAHEAATPSAAAAFVISSLKSFEERIDALFAKTERLTSAMFEKENNRLSSLSSRFGIAALKSLSDRSKGIDAAFSRLDKALASVWQSRINGIETVNTALRVSVDKFLLASATAIDRVGQAVKLLDPASILQRGFSITLLQGRALKSASDAAPGAVVTTLLADGEIKSTII